MPLSHVWHLRYYRVSDRHKSMISSTTLDRAAIKTTSQKINYSRLSYRSRRHGERAARSSLISENPEFGHVSVPNSRRTPGACYRIMTRDVQHALRVNIQRASYAEVSRLPSLLPFYFSFLKGTQGAAVHRGSTRTDN